MSEDADDIENKSWIVHKLHSESLGIPLDHLEESEIFDSSAMRCLSLNSFSGEHLEEDPETNHIISLENTDGAARNTEKRALLQNLGHRLLKKIARASSDLANYKEEDEGDGKASCSSEITELSSSQFDHQRDLQSRPCCLCLII